MPPRDASPPGPPSRGIPSPCIGVCTLDPATRRCTGCLRTAVEIARWPEASQAERQAIVTALEARRREHGAAGTTAGGR